MAEALRDRGMTVTFAGSSDRVEARLVPESGYAFDGFAIAGFPRRAGGQLARALALAAASPVACARILARRQPDVVLGGGGYVAGPMVLAAWLKRIPAALTEADAKLGLANQLAAPFARRVFLALPVSGRDGGKYTAVGRPIPSRSRAVARAEARERLQLPAEGPVVLVFGGSLGAWLLNDLAVETWGAAGPAIVHLCGERDYDVLRTRVSRPDYRLLPFLDDIGLAYGAADVAVARAGGSVWELAAAGLPAVLVPGEFATGAHQEKNARWFEEAGGAVVVPEADVRRIPQLVSDLLADEARLARMRDAMRAAAKPDAAERIADELVALAAARR
ncbi:MAG TPA: UDP-N-acetylglucosamine--N-acetylmuramyl-(pentapeptide) pyrophosphoryl-undecaprenol N-acetylglucosamine transferase [Candidatus Limnocylindria bacterium]|nr:UDP-N-acetylglucosamine--N-acetylmuramyl-(pentapeptide) pyrophosphoryl-undecaprenol N-acetylglucosamine transferase [Candidatus Limnocylindria bacterium]